MQKLNEESGDSGEKSEEPRQFDVLARNMVRLFDEGAKALGALAERSQNGSGPYSMAAEAGEAAKSLGEIARHWVKDPGKLATAQGELFKGYAELWGRSVRRFLGEEVKPVIEPEPGDNRFKDPDWSNTQYFDFCKQAYLLTSRWAEDVTRTTEGVDDKTRARAMFYLEQLLAALSPSNFALTNPEVMRATIASNAENLVQGMAHLVKDLEQSKDLLRISQTDLSAFEVGRNLAVTPGKVVFQNDIIQLIQYSPSTAEVYERPLLIVPPWINKYYILDLVPEKSFVKAAVDQGFTVFMVSWVNPDARLSQKTFEDYMHEGILAATDAVIKQTGQPWINALGYCVGGTLLASTLAYMAATRRPQDRLGELPRRTGRFQQGRRSSGLYRRRPVEVARGDDGRARLSRRLAHGGGVQHASPTRPDLALCREQLSARQEAVPVRSLVLEFGFDAAAGRQSRVLFARILSSESVGQRRDDAWRDQARPRQGHRSDLRARD